MLGVCDCVTDDVFEEYLEDTSCLFVDESRDTLDTTTTSEATNSRLGDTLDVVTQNLSVALGTSLSESFSSFAAACSTS